MSCRYWRYKYLTFSFSRFHKHRNPSLVPKAKASSVSSVRTIQAIAVVVPLKLDRIGELSSFDVCKSQSIVPSSPSCVTQSKCKIE